MKTYLQMDGDKLVEYVEKREYDLLAQERADFGVLVDKLERELQDAVKRMEAVTQEELVSAYWGGNVATNSVVGANRIRDLLIQAAKGEQP
jgi:hypothetical protein